MHSLSQAMTRFTVPGTPHAPDIPVWQASRLFQSRKRESGQRWVVVLDICLYFPLQQSELLVTHCNEDVGHHFGPWLIKKLDTYTRPPSNMTAHLVSIRGLSVLEVMTEMLVLQLFFYNFTFSITHYPPYARLEFLSHQLFCYCYSTDAGHHF